jgi:glycosyltransferase involved in cell wall biosynthesis
LAAAWSLWRLTRRNDIVVAKTDPPLLSVMAAIIARLKGARLINWLQDIFPEVAEALNIGGRAGKLCFRFLRAPRNWSLRAASCNVVVGARMAEHLILQGISPTKIRVIPNWADGELVTPLAAAQNELRKRWSLNEHFVVAYAGNLGRSHEVTTIIEAMTLLNERAVASTGTDVNRRISFVFVGGGAQFATLQREASRRELTNVQFHPYQPREHLREALGVADLHLVSLIPECEGLIVPSKFYGIAAAGRPALLIGAADGEIARLVNETGCGFVVTPGDHPELVDRIRELAQDRELCARMGERARKAFEKHWDRSYGVERWKELLLATAKAPN